MKFPHVSSKTATVAGPAGVAGIRKVTPSAPCLSYSRWMSADSNDVAGMPSRWRALVLLGGRVSVGLQQQLDAGHALRRGHGVVAGAR